MNHAEPVLERGSQLANFGQHCVEGARPCSRNHGGAPHSRNRASPKELGVLGDTGFGSLGEPVCRARDYGRIGQHV